MRYSRVTLILVALLTVSACGGRLSPRTARQQIATLGRADLATEDVQIRRILTEVGNRAIAETTLQLAFQFERDSGGEWQIVAARLGDRRWIDIATLLAALEAEEVDQTRASLEKLAAGVEAYRSQSGTLPEVGPQGHVSDVLHPLYMSEFVREDAWGGSIRFERAEQAYQLRSPGPDGITGNGDDIVIGAETP